MDDPMKSINNLFLPAEYPLRTRNLETAFVNHSKSTGLWITTISDPGPKRNAIKAFSFRSEGEAKETAYVNAPPKMIPTRTVTHCFSCESKFTVFRRATHCKNCGVCICNSCTVSWKASMLPETYLKKNSRVVKVCPTCDYISSLFRHALLNGDFEMSKKLYMTGNINLRCPFTNIKKGNEVMLPIHCAAYGGSLQLLSWLVDIHYCPLQMIHTGNRSNQIQKITSSLIQTSKGRTVADIAMDSQNFEILKYLVNDKNISLTQGNDKKNSSSFAALEMLLKSNAVCPSPSKEPSGAMSPTMLRSPRPSVLSPTTLRSPRLAVPDSPRRVANTTHRRTLSSPKTPIFNRNVVKVIPNNYLQSPSRSKRSVVKVKSSEMFSPRPEKKFFFDQCEMEKKKPPALPARIKTVSRIKLSSSTASETIELSAVSSDSVSTSDDSNPAPKENTNKVKGVSQVSIPSYKISRFSNESDDDSDVEGSNFIESFDDDESVATTVDDTCIVCCDKVIDCVFNGCGHQVCCLECASKLPRCPMCNIESKPIRIFRP